MCDKMLSGWQASRYTAIITPMDHQFGCLLNEKLILADVLIANKRSNDAQPAAGRVVAEEALPSKPAQDVLET